jgi:hypothetical protein
MSIVPALIMFPVGSAFTLELNRQMWRKEEGKETKKQALYQRSHSEKSAQINKVVISYIYIINVINNVVDITNEVVIDIFYLLKEMKTCQPHSMYLEVYWSH